MPTSNLIWCEGSRARETAIRRMLRVGRLRFRLFMKRNRKAYPLRPNLLFHHQMPLRCSRQCSKASSWWNQDAWAAKSAAFAKWTAGAKTLSNIINSSSNGAANSTQINIQTPLFHLILKLTSLTLIINVHMDRKTEDRCGQRLKWPQHKCQVFFKALKTKT